MRGRPERSPIELHRTKLWAQSVCAYAGRRPDDLTAVLGNDGLWEGMWSRYIRGTVTPSPERRKRIDKTFRGTERYYSSPLWLFAEDREYSWSEIRNAASWLKPLFRQAFIDESKSANTTGKFWKTEIDRFDAIRRASMLIRDQNFGMDALTAITIFIREAELLQDGEQYLYALMAFAKAEQDIREHFILNSIPTRFFEYVLKPLRGIQFSESELEKSWSRQLTNFCEQTNATRTSLDILSFMREHLYLYISTD
jgi:hypothetical protein